MCIYLQFSGGSIVERTPLLQYGPLFMVLCLYVLFYQDSVASGASPPVPLQGQDSPQTLSRLLRPLPPSEISGSASGHHMSLGI